MLAEQAYREQSNLGNGYDKLKRLFLVILTPKNLLSVKKQK